MPEVTGLVNRSQEEAQVFSLTTKGSTVMWVSRCLRDSSFRVMGNSLFQSWASMAHDAPGSLGYGQQGLDKQNHS